MLLFTPVLASTAYATQWVGNDNGEFGFSCCAGEKLSSGWVEVYASLSQSMSYTSPNGDMSLQYNPDKVTSQNYQTNGDAFQAGIGGQSSTSGSIFLVEVFDSSGGLVWYYIPNQLTTVKGMFNQDASWEMSEDTNSGGYIMAVSFNLLGGGSGAGSSGTTVYPPTNWYWLRSNVYWCGSDNNGESATFTSGAGTLTYYSSVNLDAIGPPIYIGTQENSNMIYGCLQNSGTTDMYQSFGSSQC